MKALKMIFPKINLLIKDFQKLIGNTEKISYHKFNKEIFYINLGSGIVSTIIGLYFIGTSQINSSIQFKSAILNSSQPENSVLPHSAGELVTFLFGNILLLLGVVCIFLALKLVVRYLASKLNN